MHCVCEDTTVQKVQEHMAVTIDATGEPQDKQIHVAECVQCGVLRQVDLPFQDEKSWRSYYESYPPTLESYTRKDYEHDRQVARLRCDNYDADVTGRMLDVGSGSGAFVDEVRSRGLEAFGCDLARYAYARNHEYIYQGTFEDVHFPTDHFDTVTCHDVLEHVLDPVKFVQELFRVTRQYGSCLIDFPRFHHEAGEHHWKDSEHIWFFTEEQVRTLLEKVGFLVTDVSYPIESKVLFRAIKPTQSRATILVPPGIGDSYWSITKLGALIEQQELGVPDVYVACNRTKQHGGHLRALPFIEMFPFLCSSGKSLPTGGRSPLWKEAYTQRGRTIFRNVLNCDYFVSYNGHLRFGEEMEKLDPDLAVNWVPDRFVSLEEENYRRVCQQRFGPYIVFYLVFGGTYRHWTREFGLRKVVASCNAVVEKTGCRPVFVGAVWDKDDSKATTVIDNVPGAVDLRGRTSIAQAFGLLRGAQVVIGYPSGLSIMSAVFGQKTLIIWNDYYNRDFFWNCVPPDTRRVTYFCENTKALSPARLIECAVELTREGS